MQNALSTKHFLSIIFNMPDSQQTICITNVYGPQRIQEKFKMLEDLNEIRQHHGANHWILGGDFNMITNLAEKKGGLRRLDKDAEAFSTFIAASKLIDVPTVNGLHTWNNKQGGNRQVASRLDRFLISESIMLQNLDMEANILPIGGSDHWPVQLHFTNMNKPQNRPFRFESFWIDHPTFMQNIQSWWTQTSVKSDNIMYIFQQKLKIIKAKLKCWNKNTFGNIFQAKKELEEKMAGLQQTMIKDGPNEDRLAQESNLQKQWEDRLRQEELLWKQKSRALSVAMVKTTSSISCSVNSLKRREFCSSVTKGGIALMTLLIAWVLS